MSKTHLTETRFDQLGLQPEVISGLEAKGLHNCTPIQAASLPVVHEGNDVAGQAQTGTGKTIAFLSAMFNHLLVKPEPENRQQHQPRALIMAPTRELAIQIHNDAIELSSATGLTMGLAYGGEGYESQREQLEQGVDILIGTTGRLLDYLKKGVYNLGSIQCVVLDEADRMFDLGFIKDIRYLFNRMPDKHKRLNMLFSATLSFRVKELAFDHMNDPVEIEIEPEQKTGHRIQEELFYPSNNDKMRLFMTLMEEEWPDKAIVFANTKQCCEALWGQLEADKHRVGLLTGDVAQNKRVKILEQFTQGKLDILVATDVAARGLHIPDVSHVFNYDLPDDPEDYVHRIGRTGRAGASGHAISLACEQYVFNLPAIEACIAHTIPVSNYDHEALLDDLAKPKRIHKAKPGNRQSRERNDRNRINRNHKR